MECSVVLKENVEIHLSKIANVMRTNYLALLTCAAIAVAAFLVSLMMLHLALTAVSNYNTLTHQNAQPAAPDPLSASGAAASATADDVVYADEAADAIANSGLASNLQDSDNSRVQAAMVRLKNKYAQYNAAMADYAARVQYRTPDDLMDETILSRGNDDFRYTPYPQEN